MVTLIVMGFMVLVGFNLAYGEAVICGDSNKLFYFEPTVDPTRARVCPEPYVKTVLSEQSTAGQITYYDTKVAAGEIRYIRVLNGLMEDMTQAQKDAVDAPLIAEAEKKASYQNEAVNNDFCNEQVLANIDAKIEQVNQNLNTAINNVTNVATAKTALMDVKNVMISGFKKLTKCVRAVRR